MGPMYWAIYWEIPKTFWLKLRTNVFNSILHIGPIKYTYTEWHHDKATDFKVTSSGIDT